MTNEQMARELAYIITSVLKERFIEYQKGDYQPVFKGFIPDIVNDLTKAAATYVNQKVVEGKIEASEKAHRQYILGHTKVDFIPFEELEKMALSNIESDKASYEAQVKLADLTAQLDQLKGD